MRTLWGTFGFFVTTCVAAAPQCGFAQSGASNAGTGQKLADQYCSQCHAVVHNGKATWTDAPAFDAIASRQDEAAAKLSVFI